MHSIAGTGIASHCNVVASAGAELRFVVVVFGGVSLFRRDATVHVGCTLFLSRVLQQVAAELEIVARLVLGVLG